MIFFSWFSRLGFKKDHEDNKVRDLLLHSAFTLTFTSGLSYGMGLVRDKIFASQVPAQARDIYNAAFVIPDLLLALLIAGALSAAFVPLYTDLWEEKSVKAHEYMNRVMSFGVVGLVVLSVVVGIVLPLLVDDLVPGFSVKEKLIYIDVVRLMLLSPLFFAISNTLGYALLTHKHYLWFGLAPVLYNLGIILGVLFLYPSLGVAGIVLGTLMGAFLHLSIRLPAIWQVGFRFKFDLVWDEHLKKTVILMLPKMLQIGLWQILLVQFASLATLYDGVSYYNFARNFQSVPVSLIGMSIALAAYSELSHLGAQKNVKQFQRLLWSRFFVIVVVTSLAAAFIGLFSFPIIDFFIGGGQFSQGDVSITASLLSVYIWSIPLESSMHLLARAHYALKNTFIPSFINVLSLLLTIFLSRLLIYEIGLFAIPVSFAVGFLLQVVLLAISINILLYLRREY